MRELIINADDFGFTRDVNAGIVHAHTAGVLTSTTLMANGDAFDDAVRLARETPSLDIGGHLVLVQGHSLLDGRAFPATVAQLLKLLARGGMDVYAELRAQVEKIRAAGIPLTHLDSHKHTHLVPRVFRAVVRLAREFQIPYVRLPLDRTSGFGQTVYALGNRSYRNMANGANVRVTDHFLGFALTGTFTEETFLAALDQVKDGLTEFMCHPGYLAADLADAPTRLKESRVRELEALTAPRVRQAIEERSIQLRPF